ncbi:glycoside hydrolase family 30 protein [Nitrospirillum iridis]|uniref:Glucosylceramidase n=1 Tax=Nitrospirillum iridis TaxID=765888 RepID=A0A7X0EG46_9PROT|nr:glycoside hydrolase family 30 protein [Nitrospirillum iridis]MBB6254610.1 glucosylceramidase [Nitrospirillum iridis]
MNRRDFLAATGAVTGAAAGAVSGAGAVMASAPGRAVAAPATGGAPVAGVTWRCTTRKAAWQACADGLTLGDVQANPFGRDAEVRLDQPRQTMAGFGGAFSERGWLALRALPAPTRDAVLDALFAPGQGLGFTLCRTPIGANDISRGWYSYDEVDGDFALDHFSVANDQDTLIPFIQQARARQPGLKLWASPWSPPTWMKTNRHYAMTPAWPGQPSNGLAPDQQGREGRDHFIQEDRYFDAYALYFRRYVEAYAQAGIPISAVMPQNEFNSAQPFPSCCWTPAGLARFIPHLGREMAKVGVDIHFGTLERANADLLSQVMADPAAGPLLHGVGVQWAGKGALPIIRDRHPGLAIWASEQECGTGTNDWHYARYAWGLMKLYLLNGASAYQYWNMVMPPGGMSGWGWPQNALVTVDPATGGYRFNPDFHVMKHVSHFVAPGARLLPVDSFTGYDNQLAFLNPDGSVVVVAQNDLAEPWPLRLKLGNRLLTLRLPADSFNTVHIAGGLA